MSSRFHLILASLLLVLAFEGFAHAATSTVCFSVVVKDDVRFDCPSGTADADRRPCRENRQGGPYSIAAGWEVELWDKDPVGPDDFLGAFLTPNSLYGCYSFTWSGTDTPDVYIKLTNQLFPLSSTTAPYLQITDNNGVLYAKASWRDGTAQNSDAFVATNCSGTCNLLPNQSFVINPDTATNYGKAVLAADSAQRALQVFYPQMIAQPIKIRIPSGSTLCTSICATSQSTIDYTPSHGQVYNGATAAHELGHLVQMMQFQRNDLRNDCSKTTAGHPFNEDEYESCATAEGFADYVAAASWWNPENNTTGDPAIFGYFMESANPVIWTSCSANKSRQAQVARTFWDLDDANNEPAGWLDVNNNGVYETRVDADGDGTLDNDNAHLDTLLIVSKWSTFITGTNAAGENLELKNRGRFEADTATDRDGVNLKDWIANGNYASSLLLHNCVNGQDDN